MAMFPLEKRQEIGARLKLLRRTLNDGRGMPLQEMADRLGVSYSHYTHCETGSNSFSARFLETVCRVFGVSHDWLVDGDGEMMVCETREERQGYVVRMVEKVDPARIAALFLDGKVQEQAQSIAKVLGVDIKKALEIVIAQRLEGGPSRS